MEKIYDLLIIGGGAGGLSAGVTAGLRGKKVVILEKEEKLGKKILVSGNGKCNLSAARIGAENYNTAAVSDIIKTDVRGFFSSLGLATKESDGRIYPYSESALSVLNVLRRKFNGDVILNTEAKEITYDGGLFSCCGLKASNVLLASGSNATRGTDSTALYGAFGHTVRPFKPAIVPLVTDTAYIKGLSGIRAKCAVALLCAEGEMERKGELLFKDNGISGIVSMTLSSFLARCGGRGDIKIDFTPELSLNEVRRYTELYGAESFLQRAVAQCVEKQARDRKIEACECIKDFRIRNVRCGDMKNAQVACGGLDLSEFDENLQSKKQKGLYACGEVLDVDGECGGYNLHFAFAGGIIVGNAVC